MATPERKTDIGPPKYDKFLPPIVKKNYGKWAYHEIPEPRRRIAFVEQLQIGVADHVYQHHRFRLDGQVFSHISRSNNPVIAGQAVITVIFHIKKCQPDFPVNQVQV